MVVGFVGVVALGTNGGVMDASFCHVVARGEPPVKEFDHRCVLVWREAVEGGGMGVPADKIPGGVGPGVPSDDVAAKVWRQGSGADMAAEVAGDTLPCNGERAHFGRENWGKGVGRVSGAQRSEELGRQGISGDI